MAGKRERASEEELVVTTRRGGDDLSALFACNRAWASAKTKDPSFSCPWTAASPLFLDRLFDSRCPRFIRRPRSRRDVRPPHVATSRAMSDPTPAAALQFAVEALEVEHASS